MERFLELIGWKTYYGRWDKDEIVPDIAVLTAVIVVSIAIFYNY